MKAREIADFLGGKLHGDGEVEINRVAELSAAGDGDIAYSTSEISLDNIGASCVIVSNKADLLQQPSSISVSDPKLAFAKIAAILHPGKSRPGERHPSAVIAETSNIGKDVFVGGFVCVGENSSIGDGTQLRAGAKIGDDVTIGANCILHPNVLVEDGCSIGDNVILHSGVVIGADGFGYVKDENGSNIKFPQIGTVVIEDNVEIGANTCVDRGALGETRIGEGTKIDNLVQIAHNVQIGKRVLIAAQTGISGSCVIEDDCVIGGQVGMGDHVHVRSGAIIGSQAGILPGKIVRPGVWWGTPIQPLSEYKRQHARLKRIEDVMIDIEELKRERPNHS